MLRAAWANAYIVGFSLALASGVTTETPDAAPTTHVVTIENMQYSPSSMTVDRGDRIVWMNKDLFPHTATADSKAFDSSAIAAQASWSYVANTPGEYSYFCAYHPTMKAKLTVR